MRRARIIFASLLVLCGVFAATASAGADDGTLAIANEEGFASINATGTVIGRITDYATIRIVDLDTTDGGIPIIGHCPGRQNISAQTPNPDDKTIRCVGEDIRFRIVGGAFRIVASGQGIYLSAAGQGRVTLYGMLEPPVTGSGLTGTYSVNDGDFAPIPLEKRTFALDASATT
jgi:hypothetical protein